MKALLMSLVAFLCAVTGFENNAFAYGCYAAAINREVGNILACHGETARSVEKCAMENCIEANGSREQCRLILPPRGFSGQSLCMTSGYVSAAAVENKAGSMIWYTGQMGIGNSSSEAENHSLWQGGFGLGPCATENACSLDSTITFSLE